MAEADLRILIAEDSAADRLILETIVTQAGHQAIPVEDGLQALRAYEETQPDIVLLDVLMPNMGGLETARELRARHANDLVPILFLTSLTDTDSLVECIEAGGNDFIPKPYNKTVLHSKIKAFARVRDMHKTLAQQKKQIELNNLHLIQEQTVAKQVFDKIAHTGCLDQGLIRYSMSPLAVFNGDVLVADVSPSGSLMVLLGDFTGHGLPAAIGSMPLATTFYGMVRKGFGIAEIAREINQKLHDTLPTGFFCCAALVDINLQNRRLRYWNGGLPASYLYKKSSDDYRLLESQNLPFGVLSSKKFKSEVVSLPIEEGDRIYLWSDGIFEARDPDGVMFGEQRLDDLMRSFRGRDDLMDAVLGKVYEHIGDGNKDDDLSFVEIPIHELGFPQPHPDYGKSVRDKLVDWSMDFRLEASTFKQFDPLPLVTGILNEVTGLIPHRTMLYTLIAELYSNALEHGILGLSSSLKNTPQGFVEYYDKRKKKLAEVGEGQIIFSVQHRQTSDESGIGGELIVRLRDSGVGFGVSEVTVHENDVRSLPRPLSEDRDSCPQYYGRGLKLMSASCSKLTIRPPGNDVEIVFVWHESDAKGDEDE